jgi:hypothetical protein
LEPSATAARKSIDVYKYIQASGSGEPRIAAFSLEDAMAALIELAVIIGIPVMAYKGVGFGRGLYAGLCVLSIFGSILFFAVAEKGTDGMNVAIFLTQLSFCVLCGSVLGMCFYRKPSQKAA